MGVVCVGRCLATKLSSCSGVWEKLDDRILLYENSDDLAGICVFVVVVVWCEGENRKVKAKGRLNPQEKFPERFFPTP